LLHLQAECEPVVPLYTDNTSSTGTFSTYSTVVGPTYYTVLHLKTTYNDCNDLLETYTSELGHTLTAFSYEKKDH